MAFNSTDRIAVSTWSLHRMLGTTYPHELTSQAIGAVEETYGEVSESLLDIPSAIANHGINRLELVSFHLPSRDTVYLGELRHALSAAEVSLQTLLIDAGDISDAATSARDIEWIWSWIEIAHELGAERARVIAGKQKPTRDALDRSIKALTELSRRNEGSKLRLTTENWFDLLAEPAQVHYLLDKLEGRIGLNGDFGNWDGAHKYDDLRAIMGRAETCHAKGNFAKGRLDEVDYAQCLQAADEAGYKGPYTLIFDADSPDEWAGIEMEKQFIEELLG